MSPASSLSLCWTLSLCLLVSVSADPVTIRAEPGEDISLPCRAPNNTHVTVEWSRHDLEPEYVLLYRDGTPDPHNQHPSFEGRVELEDREMKDGDVSMILKNVNRDDAGTYECRVFQGETNRRRRYYDCYDCTTVNVQVNNNGGWSGSSVVVAFIGGVLAALGGYVLFG